MWIVNYLLLVSWLYPFWLWLVASSRMIKLVNVVCTLLIWALSWCGLYYIYQGWPVTYALVPNTWLYFTLDAPGAVFIWMVSTLWLLNLIYSFSYMFVAYPDKNHHSFFIFLSMSLASTILLAFAKNLPMLILGYELLTITTIPLISYKHDKESLDSAAFYAKMLLGTSLVFLLPVMVHIDFYHSPYTVLLAFMLLGAAKAATFPVHSWLPRAMVAPVPVSAFLHAIAVVKSGVFVIYRILSHVELEIDVVYFSPRDLLQIWLLISIAYASYQAIRHSNLKLRLAFSTMQQLNVMVAMFLTGNHHIISHVFYYMINHGFAKLTLFACVGYISLVVQKHNLQEIRGICSLMPTAVLMFAIAAASIIGLPLTAGFWGKEALLHSVQNTSTIWPALSLIVASCGSFLNFSYMVYVMVDKNHHNASEPRIAMTAKQRNIAKSARNCLYVFVFSAVMCLLLSAGNDFIIRLLDGPSDQPVELQNQNNYLTASGNASMVVL